MAQSITKLAKLLIILALGGLVLSGGLAKLGATIFNAVTHNANAARMGQHAFQQPTFAPVREQVIPEQTFDHNDGLNMYERMAERRIEEQNQERPVVNNNPQAPTREVPLYAGIRNQEPHRPLAHHHTYHNRDFAENGETEDYLRTMRENIDATFRNMHNFQNMERQPNIGRNVEERLTTGRDVEGRSGVGVNLAEQENAAAKLQYLLKEDAKKIPLVHSGFITEKGVPFGKTSLIEEGTESFNKMLMEQMGINEKLITQETKEAEIKQAYEILSGDFKSKEDKAEIAARRVEKPNQTPVLEEQPNQLIQKNAQTAVKKVETEVKDFVGTQNEAKELARTGQKQPVVFKKIIESPYRRPNQVTNKPGKPFFKGPYEAKDLKSQFTEKKVPLIQVSNNSKGLQTQGSANTQIKKSEPAKNMLKKKSSTFGSINSQNTQKQQIADLLKDENDIVTFSGESANKFLFKKTNNILIETNYNSNRVRVYHIERVPKEDMKSPSSIRGSNDPKNVQTFKKGVTEVTKPAKGSGLSERDLKDMLLNTKDMHKTVQILEEKDGIVVVLHVYDMPIAENQKNPGIRNLMKEPAKELDARQVDPKDISGQRQESTAERTLGISLNAISQIHGEQKKLPAVKTQEDTKIASTESQIANIDYFRAIGKTLLAEMDRQDNSALQEKSEVKPLSQQAIEKNTIETFREEPTAMSHQEESGRNIVSTGQEKTATQKFSPNENAFIKLDDVLPPAFSNEQKGLSVLNQKSVLPLKINYANLFLPKHITSVLFQNDPLVSKEFGEKVATSILPSEQGTEIVGQKNAHETEITQETNKDLINNNELRNSQAISLGSEKISIDTKKPQGQAQTGFGNIEDGVKIAGFGNVLPGDLQTKIGGNLPIVQEGVSTSKITHPTSQYGIQSTFANPFSGAFANSWDLFGQNSGYQSKGLGRFRYGMPIGAPTASSFTKNLITSQKALIKEHEALASESSKHLKVSFKTHVEALKDSAAYFERIFANEPPRAERGTIFYSQKLSEFSVEENLNEFEKAQLPLSRAAQVYIHTKDKGVDEDDVPFVFMNTYIDPRPLSVLDTQPLPPMDWNRLLTIYQKDSKKFSLMQLKAFLEPKPENFTRESLMGLPYYNLVLDLEEICIERFLLSRCRQLAVMLFGLHQQFSTINRQNYNVVQSAIESIFEGLMTPESVQFMNDAADAGKLYDSAQHMADRLQFLLFRYAAA